MKCQWDEMYTNRSQYPTEKTFIHC